MTIDSRDHRDRQEGSTMDTKAKTPVTDAVEALPAPLPAHVVARLLAVAEAAEEWVGGEGDGTRIAHELSRLHDSSEWAAPRL